MLLGRLTIEKHNVKYVGHNYDNLGFSENIR
jgi:hypothetical protein